MQPKLKPVQTRDGSKPIIAGNDEGETDDVVRDPKPRSSHCNEPRDGAALDRSFIFDYINPMSAYRSVFLPWYRLNCYLQQPWTRLSESL